MRIRWLPLRSQPSINSLLATSPHLSVNLLVRRQSAASLRVSLSSIHSFRKYSRRPTLLSRGSVPSPGGGQVE